MNNYSQYIYLSYIFTISSLLIYFYIIVKNYNKSRCELKKLNEKN